MTQRPIDDDRASRRFATIVNLVRIGLGLLLLGFAVFVIQQFGGAPLLREAITTGQIRELKPARLQGPLLRTARGGADRIYLLTTQSETIVRIKRRATESGNSRQMLHVDLWAIDPATVRPAWRRRLHTFVNHEADGLDLRRLSLLGADGSSLWLSLRGPLAVSLADGSTLADGARIDQANPALAGKRVDDSGYVAFGAHGLQLTLTDGSQWRIDGSTFQAAPRDTPARDPGAIVAPVEFAETDQFQLRGLPIGDRWLGVLSDAEAQALQRQSSSTAAASGHSAAMQHFLEFTAGPEILRAEPRPYRLWSARVAQVSSAPPGWPKGLGGDWGTHPRYSDYAMLLEAPSFLQAGLLRASPQVDQALWYRAPDSVLVLHHDKLGEAGRLAIARVAGPAGRVVWNATLPLAELNSVLRGEQDLVLLGSEPPPPADAVAPEKAPSDVAAELPHQQLVRIAVADGAAASFDLTRESLRELPAD